MATCATTSVSGRGTNTPGSTRSVRYRKPGRPDQVLQRLAVAAALDQAGELLGEPVRHRRREHELEPLLPEHVRGERGRVVPRGLHARVGEEPRGALDERAQVGGPS